MLPLGPRDGIVPLGLDWTCHPAHKAAFISHDTPPPLFFQENNLTYMAVKAAFIYLAFDPPPRTVIIIFLY